MAQPIFAESELLDIKRLSEERLAAEKLRQQGFLKSINQKDTNQKIQWYKYPYNIL